MKQISAVCEVLHAEELEALLEKPSNPVPKPKWFGLLVSLGWDKQKIQKQRNK